MQLYRIRHMVDLFSYIWTSILALVVIIKQLPIWIWIIGALMFLPVVTALPEASGKSEKKLKQA